MPHLISNKLTIFIIRIIDYFNNFWASTKKNKNDITVVVLFLFTPMNGKKKWLS